MSLFFFLRLVSGMLVDRLQYSARWRLLDLWNSMNMLGQACLGYAYEDINPNRSRLSGKLARCSWEFASYA
jgi:hypothetical protein